VIVAETHEVTALSGIREKGGNPMGFICRLSYAARQEDGILAEFIQAGPPAPPGVPNQGIDERVAVRIPGDASFAAPTELKATLVDAIDIDLQWKDNATAEAGYFVEGYFVGGPDASTREEFVIIDALPPNTTTYRHARLLPQTRFVYRVRPFFGGPSNVAEVTTGKEGPQKTLDSEPPPPGPSTAADAKKSLRLPTSAAEAAPIGLTATLIPPAGVQLQWKDRASDEDEYVLEIKPEWDTAFKASAFLERDATSVTSYDFPFETRFAFRVRAFFYGAPSNLAEQTTGLDPSMPAAGGRR
jgi:hypothetical protein